MACSGLRFLARCLAGFRSLSTTHIIADSYSGEHRQSITVCLFTLQREESSPCESFSELGR